MVSSVRMGGLVSGLDTETIIKNLMKNEKAPLNKLLQKKQSEEWRRDQYREMNNLLLDLKKTTFDMKLQGTFQKKAVTSGNEALVTATQKGGVPSLSTYSVEVTSLPTAAKAASVKFSTSVSDTSTAVGQAFKFNVNGTQISVAAGDTMSDIIGNINANSATTGVTASYFQGDKSISFTSTTSGGTAEVKIDNITVASNPLGLSEMLDPVKGTAATSGTVYINGFPSSFTGSTVNFDGIEFNMKSLGTTTVSVKTDEDATFNIIKGFVDKYNDVIGKINAKISESYYRDYAPLLDEQKEAMSEKQIEQWEEKSKSGLLRQDTLLSGALTDMRRAISSQVSGGSDPKFDTLSAIGITTGLYSENGKLSIDEKKLRKAISENGTQVMELFTKTSTAADDTTKYKESGVAQRLYDQLNSSISKVTDKAGSALYLTDNSMISKGLKRINTDISSWETRLKQIEDRYWKKFSAMETAMSKANSQSSWLSAQSK